MFVCLLIINLFVRWLRPFTSWSRCTRVRNKWEVVWCLFIDYQFICSVTAAIYIMIQMCEGESVRLFIHSAFIYLFGGCGHWHHDPDPREWVSWIGLFTWQFLSWFTYPSPCCSSFSSSFVFPCFCPCSYACSCLFLVLCFVYLFIITAHRRH